MTHGRRVTSASVAWSPDGHRLAYDMGRSAHLERGTPLVVSRADGSHRKVVSPPHEHVIAPAWSPDGSRIAYISAYAPGDFAGRSGDVEVVPVTGGAPRKLAVEYSGHDPVWSPGGREVVFATSWQGGQGFAEVGTRPRSTVFLTFDCCRRLRCDTIGRPTFAPGDGAIGFIAVVDHPPRSVVAVARHGAMTESAPLLRFPLYRCCLSWWTSGPGQRSV